MTFMMDIKSMTSMKSMKWMVHIRIYIECKCYIIAYSFLPYVIIIISDIRDEGCCNDSTVIAT